MGLSTEMKNLSDEIISSFKQRIKENEELVIEVKSTLNDFKKGHQEMTDVLNANAAALRKDLASGEKERINTYSELMKGISQTITSIEKEVVAIQTSTFSMIKDFSADRAQMAEDLNKFFTQNKSGRMENEKSRMSEFDTLMKDINANLKSLSDEVLSIFKNTNDMIERFDKEHLEMSDELRADLSKNLNERITYTNTMLNGFQQRLLEIGKQNQEMAQNLRNALANGESERLNEYNGLMNSIQKDIKGICKGVNELQKGTANMISDLSKDRSFATAEWKRMQDTIANIYKTGIIDSPVKAEKVEVKKVTPIETQPIAKTKEPQVKVAPKPVTPVTLEEKIIDFISNHPKGVKISEMEKPLGETRMKLGFIAKKLLEESKVQKVDNVYFPLKK